MCDDRVRVLSRYRLQRLARWLLPRERVASCVWSLLPGRTGVDVLHLPETQSARYKGVMYCGSVWQCPICAATIARHRRSEIAAAVDAWQSRGGVVSLMTLTVRHSVDDRLSDLLRVLSDAWRSATQRRQWKLFRDRVGCLGYIRALEITKGDAGWHPHYHFLVFTRSALSGKDVHWLRDYWLAALRRYGRDARWDVGVDVRVGDNAVAGYLAKVDARWSIADEVSYAQSKVTRRDGNLTVWQLLDAADSDIAARSAWYEYIAATAGVPWVRWSSGLRDELGMSPEQADEDVAAALGERVVVMLGYLDDAAWATIRGLDIRAEVLAVAADGDVDVLAAYLSKFGITLRSAVGAAVGRTVCDSTGGVECVAV